MIYINFVELLSVMLHAKFQNHRSSGSGEEDFLILKVFAIYSHGGHHGHVTVLEIRSGKQLVRGATCNQAELAPHGL